MCIILVRTSTKVHTLSSRIFMADLLFVDNALMPVKGSLDLVN